jgi:ribosomal protein S12 methylthiotransferase accessory factor
VSLSRQLTHCGVPLWRRLYGVLDYLVDDEVGIIHSVDEVRAEAGAPNFFHYVARLGRPQAYNKREGLGSIPGASSTREIASAQAIAQAVALYCAGEYDPTAFPSCASKSAPFATVTPADFALYSREQYEQSNFPFTAFDEHALLRWTPAVDPMSGETYHVPAAMVFLPYEPSNEARIVAPTSTGLACHASPAEAAIAAVCDVVQCDHLMLTWQAHLTLPQIRIETLSDLNYELVSRLEQTASSVTLVDLTLDLGLPTVLGVLRSKLSAAPALVFSAAADLDPECAVQRCLEELALNLRHCWQIKIHTPRSGPRPTSENIGDQVSHLNFWCDHANTPFADFIFASSERIEFDEMPKLTTGDPQQDCIILLDRARQAGYQVLIADLTAPEIKELGLTVVRALMPGLHPLFMGYGLRALGGSRLWEVPRKLGHQGISPELGDNRAPHPFARKGIA